MVLDIMMMVLLGRMVGGSSDIYSFICIVVNTDGLAL